MDELKTEEVRGDRIGWQDSEGTWHWDQGNSVPNLTMPAGTGMAGYSGITGISGSTGTTGVIGTTGVSGYWSMHEGPYGRTIEGHLMTEVE
jgi:hypothetical protein